VTSPWLAKRMLMAPAAVRNAAARKAQPEEAWLLRQDADVRRSYVRDVLDKGGSDEREQAWMLLQRKAVREAYVREVLGL
jgi:hypothetical protein